MKRAIAAVLILCLGEVLADASVEWSSDNGALNLQSDGVTPLNGDFEFLIGSFVGIVPTVDNLSDWEGSFQSLGSTDYSTDFDRFFGTATLVSNAAPFTTNTRVYVWGRNGTVPGSEWILFGRPTWKWPNANPVGPPPFPTRFPVFEVTTDDVVLGAVGEGEVHLQTTVASFDLSYASWVEMNFGVGEDSAAGSDFDEDGRSNFLEFALDSNPKMKDEDFRVILNRSLEIEVPRVAGRTVEWVLLASDDLVGFEEMTTGFEIAVDEVERLVFRITPPLASPRFFQVEARPVD